MFIVSFNTQLHTATIKYKGADNLDVNNNYDNVMTIKENNGFYEILQRQETGKNAPLLRLPINATVIIYKHE